MQASLDAVVAAGVDHVSAYALIVEDGTRLAARMRRGELPYPTTTCWPTATWQAEATLTAAGLGWYEVSNWATTPDARCRHNLLYWTGGDWWGFGPGAHSHVGGVRWWNVKHPTAYAGRLAEGASPAHARESLDRRRPAGRGRDAAAAAARRAAAGGPGRRRVVPAPPRALADGLLDPAATQPAARC